MGMENSKAAKSLSEKRTNPNTNEEITHLMHHLDTTHTSMVEESKLYSV